MAEVREAVLFDLEPVAMNLRPEDLLELRGFSPLKALQMGFQLSEQCFTLVVDDLPVAVFGVNRGPKPQDHIGAIWLLGTPAIERCGSYFIRHSKEWLETLEQDFMLLMNGVHKDNLLHRRWLKWLGFKGISRYGDFINFVKECPCVIPA